MCPFFRNDPSEESSPRSKANVMRSLVSGVADPTTRSSPEFEKLASLCFNCRQCEIECPTNVRIPHLMIEAKAQYARQNHGEKMLGPNYINDWFDDPAGLLDELVNAGYIVPGKPEQSPTFELMSFTGPMFHVFTEAEQQR